MTNPMNWTPCPTCGGAGYVKAPGSCIMGREHEWIDCPNKFLDDKRICARCAVTGDELRHAQNSNMEKP